MSRSFLNFSAAMMIMAMSACSTMDSSHKTPEKKPSVDTHTSQNAVNWQGTYKGVLPCADCEGTATQIQLFADGTYAMSTQYLGKGDEKFVGNGAFTWMQQGRVIKLDNVDPGLYQVGENQLFHLDMAGQRIAGDLAKQYILTKVMDVSIEDKTKAMNMSIEDKKWQLIELNGKAVIGTAQTHYLMLTSKERLVSAKAGCNIMFGGYELKQPLQLNFKQLGSTMMACDDMTDEEQLSKALAVVDNYSISDNILSLNKARMAPLARFKLVESE